MILIQAIRNAMVNDLVVRNVADLATVPAGKPVRPSRSFNLDQALPLRWVRWSRAEERQTEARA